MECEYYYALVISLDVYNIYIFLFVKVAQEEERQSSYQSVRTI